MKQESQHLRHKVAIILIAKIFRNLFYPFWAISYMSKECYFKNLGIKRQTFIHQRGYDTYQSHTWVFRPGKKYLISCVIDL